MQYWSGYGMKLGQATKYQLFGWVKAARDGSDG